MNLPEKLLSGILNLIVVFSILIATIGIGGIGAVQAETNTLTGWFSVLYGDSQKGGTQNVYILTTDTGQKFHLAIDEELATKAGGVVSLDRKQVALSGRVQMTETFDKKQVIQVDNLSLLDHTAQFSNLTTEVTGSQPFVSIMCKFKDVADTPNNLAYFKNMYGSTQPGLDHYWREVSYDYINLLGSDAYGWYTLPRNRADYLPGGNLDWDLAAEDCTGVADIDINFTDFIGINLMFNDHLDGFAWGGGWYGTLDGETKFWNMTWEPPWGYQNVTVMSHEMGHAFGLPHSSGQYGQTYDNQWDVMSDTWSNCFNATDPTYGCLGQHTISYHKDKLGWISGDKKFVYSTGTQTIILNKLALPDSTGYRMAKVPLPDSTFYTVELRKKDGYDVKLPGEAVIIHHVNTARSRPAQVIDVDNNKNTGDGGAMWLPGETFVDKVNNIAISVLSETVEGFQISITSFTPTSKTLRSQGWRDGWVREKTEFSAVGGRKNNTSTTLYVGDNIQNKQYRSILSFKTGKVPDNAVIYMVTLIVKRAGLVGTSPFNSHNGLRVDIRKNKFSTKAALQLSDFQAVASKGLVGKIPNKLHAGWYKVILKNTALPYINKTGITQFRLRFFKDDNDDFNADYLKLYSGDSILANRPQLIVWYFVP